MLNIFNIDYFVLVILAIIVASILGWIFMIKDIRCSPRRIYNKLSEDNIRDIKATLRLMEGREFEEFCAYLFSKTNKYKEVQLTAPTCDGGKDIILKDKNDETIFVECKRYSSINNSESCTIGREIVQKLAGAMLQNGITKGIIITTGNIHKNGWGCINDIETNNPDYKIDIICLEDIINMINTGCDTEILDKFCIKSSN